MSEEGELRIGNLQATWEAAYASRLPAEVTIEIGTAPETSNRHDGDSYLMHCLRQIWQALQFWRKWTI
ncbi:unnamed protein product [Caenorhabditis sp. 36 PRJEB53466]|nr:unnamed protein product [Caenorhabditis sp. 36 PRJEB53466]